jgi:hypothetical protein
MYGWKDATVEEVDSPLVMAVQPEASRERRRVLLDLAHALRQQAARADADTRTGVPAVSIAQDAVEVMRFVAGQLVALAKE